MLRNIQVFDILMFCVLFEKVHLRMYNLTLHVSLGVRDLLFLVGGVLGGELLCQKLLCQKLLCQTFFW